MKRILTLQDMSCVGKCSLTVALPIISAMGVEACPLPTALLSTHTAFPEFSFLDLTKEMTVITDVFSRQSITFDGLYSGYLGSIEQTALVKRIFAALRHDGCPVLVDPAMADNGKLYAGLPSDFPAAMASLCAEADIVVPNLTEAALMLSDLSLLEKGDAEGAKEILRRLTDMGPSVAVLTGVREGSGIGAMAYDRTKNTYTKAMKPYLDHSFHGTGDVFASVLFGALVRECPMEKALELSVGFVWDSMVRTMNDPAKPWYGVNFEEALPQLINSL